MSRRHSIWAILVIALLTGCAVAAPSPSAALPAPSAAQPSAPVAQPGPPGPRISFELLVDIGIYGGPPDPVPPYHAVEFSDDTQLVLVDEGASQSLHEVRWNGERWEAIAGLEAPLLPEEEKGPYLRTIAVGTDAGFSTEAVVLLARVPNGPISRVEIQVDGTVEDIPISQKPVSATVFPPGAAIGDEFTAFDLGTSQLDSGTVHHD